MSLRTRLLLERELKTGNTFPGGPTLVASVKRLLVGSAKRTEQAVHERLSKKTGLAVFASDALSSTAYATEEILLVLAVAAVAGQTYSYHYVVPISIIIAIVLSIVATSYRQTIHAYPSGGGAYIVAKDNLGTMPGLVAAGSLLVDYVLTVSVSISAGVAAITSAAQGTRFAWLDDHKVLLCVLIIVFIAIANLRGVRESGTLFAGPTYVFVFSFLFMIGYGIIYYFLNPGSVAPVSEEHIKVAEGYNIQPLSWLLLLGAFSNGCVALTGTEAISNGIPAFKQPEARNAATTLTIMAVLLATMFIGTSIMAYLYGVHPHENETVISQFARLIFTGPMGWFYYLIQAATALILILAANTSFADFPRLSSLLARDRFLPRQFANRGDRLVFSNGIIILAIFSGILVAAFGGDTSRLIPLYAVGVFLSFTLSQTGMVRHWLRVGRLENVTRTAPLKNKRGPNAAADYVQEISEEGATLEDIHSSVTPERIAGRNPIDRADEQEQAAHWRKSIVINGVGAVATCIVLIVLIITKFIHGAWIVVLLIPLLVMLFRAVHRHYEEVAKQLTTVGFDKLRPIRHEVIVPISGIHRGVIRALEYAKSIAPGHVTAVYVDLDEEATKTLREKWKTFGDDIELVVLASPYRALTRPLLRYVARVERDHKDDMVTIVLPEFVPAKWWQHLLHNQSSLMLKGALLFKEGVIVTNVPYHLKR
ncbi:MAG TPA: APC family permease [Pyrinomonadaceae bacterium]|nr:APC family permease [Pyrinomonadaceae bacterium]